MSKVNYVDPYTHEVLNAKGDKLAGRNSNLYPVKNGIPNFSGVYEEEFGKMIREGNWIESAWDFRVDEYHETDIMQDIVKQIIKAYKDLKAPLVEIACGPGGGFMPAILTAEPEIDIYVTDIAFSVVNEWKKFFEKSNHGSNIHFAACDARYLPFPDNSISSISSIGIGNVNDIEKVFSEVYRVLKPGGFFTAEDMLLNDKTKEIMPRELVEWYEEWCEIRGQRNGKFVEIFEQLGFSRINKIYIGTNKLDPEESTLSKKAWEYGVMLEFDTYIINVNK